MAKQMSDKYGSENVAVASANVGNIVVLFPNANSLALFISQLMRIFCVMVVVVTKLSFSHTRPGQCTKVLK